MDVHNAFHTIQSVLNRVDADLSLISIQLKSEFSRHYPVNDPASSSSMHLNPVTLLENVRKIQTALPTLLESLLRIHLKKSSLATLMRQNLSALNSHALALLPIASQTPSNTPHVCSPDRTDMQKQLENALHSSDEELRSCLSAFLKVHANLTHVFQDAFTELPTDDLNLALLRAAVDAPVSTRTTQDASKDATSPVSDTSSASEKRRSGAADKKGERNENMPPSKKGSKPKASSTKRGNVPTPSPKTHDAEDATARNTSPPFHPVQKSVYNRLPRNLKIKAGKLDAINQFYEKVWSLLMKSGGALSEPKLLSSLGETDPTKLKVLQGLAVVRQTKDGWTLPRASGKA